MRSSEIAVETTCCTCTTEVTLDRVVLLPRHTNMGDGRIPVQRPTGLAHGFRPLEGDHPPPTPTQRDVTSDVGGELLSANQYGCLDSSRRSAMSRNDPSVARDGGVDEGIPPPSKKRRRLPGPLAFLQQEGAAGPAG